MKQEFNFQGLNKARTTVLAALYALPAVALTTMHYGAIGLAAMGVFTVALTVSTLHTFREGLGEDGSYRHDNIVTNDDDLQMVGDRLASRFGLSPVEVRLEQRDKSIASTDNRHIFLSPHYSRKLSDDQKAWVIAHELAHVHSAKDSYLLIPHRVAIKTNTWSCMFGTLTSVLGMTELSLVDTITVTAGSLLSLHMSSRAVQKEIELRCDANALRATGNLDAARSALIACEDMDSSPPVSRTERIMRYATLPLFTHPALSTRLRNLEKTWAAMQTEKNASSDAISSSDWGVSDNDMRVIPVHVSGHHIP